MLHMVQKHFQAKRRRCEEKFGLTFHYQEKKLLDFIAHFQKGFYLFLRGTRYVYLWFMFVNIYRYVSAACI